ncbi:tRNA1(Val) (adenine(37)-N6)-methyltransferase [Dyadobacter sp. CECT 9275]|uniref:tRNA1(Val) (adenine(37)-N6)-methyltransferase n=1 Tax=Dyadobacter helix TaxID=2822344 RepID=A0A916JCD1_9BACT|nr:methyltransferase [Dyadobacter sp. CECT 9275]CAG5002760.1 tRNA1(Val) (adenine(37)-N6)-methyltransferase [Dyadobacter sp. CECT 9275]
MAGNSFFRFKQFTVFQEKCAMKVCTDACVLGAWAGIEHVKRMLDIGAGTGLLSLMAAQRNEKILIDAVELDPEAAEQARENVSASPFGHRISIYQAAIQEFQPDDRYDCIITNPPFFQSDLRSPSEKKNGAHHAETLSFDALLEAMTRLITPHGKAHVLLPVEEAGLFLRKAENKGWVLVDNLILKHDPGKKPFRRILTIRYGGNECKEFISNELSVYNFQERVYTREFRQLLEPFYLIF